MPSSFHTDLVQLGEPVLQSGAGGVGRPGRVGSSGSSWHNGGRDSLLGIILAGVIILRSGGVLAVVLARVVILRRRSSSGRGGGRGNISGGGSYSTNPVSKFFRTDITHSLVETFGRKKNLRDAAFPATAAALVASDVPTVT